MDQPAPNDSRRRAANSGGSGGGAGLPFFTLLFSGFVALHLFWPELMARTPYGEQSQTPGGLNLAMILGIGLIVVAVVLALGGRQHRS